MSIKDPIASAMSEILIQISKLSADINDSLEQVNSEESSDQAKLNKVESIKNKVNTLDSTLSKLDTLNTLIEVADKALQAQELAIMSNPISAASFEVAKKAFKMLTYKDTLTGLADMLQQSIINSKKDFNELKQKTEAEEQRLKKINKQ
jgi:hypothetical protein